MKTPVMEIVPYVSVLWSTPARDRAITSPREPRRSLGSTRTMEAGRLLTRPFSPAIWGVRIRPLLGGCVDDDDQDETTLGHGLNPPVELRQIAAIPARHEVSPKT
jgi:hypothetical protein